MTERSLQITYRKGQLLAAYLYFSHETSSKSVRTEATSDGFLVVDYAADGRPIGVEITAPAYVTLDRLNRLLQTLNQPPMAELEFRPLSAA